MLLLLRNHGTSGTVTPPLVVRGHQSTRGYDTTASLGYERTDTLSEAIEEARGFMGRSATISLVKIPPILQTDVRI